MYWNNTRRDSTTADAQIPGSLYHWGIHKVSYKSEGKQKGYIKDIKVTKINILITFNRTTRSTSSDDCAILCIDIDDNNMDEKYMDDDDSKGREK